MHFKQSLDCVCTVEKNSDNELLFFDVAILQVLVQVLCT